MNEKKEEILINNSKEYFNSGEDELKKGRNNSAVVLFFKCLVSLCDIYILRKTENVPSSHTNRFKILKEKFPEEYDLIDKDFPFYQDSYVQLMSKELAEVIKEDAKTMADKIKIELF